MAISFMSHIDMNDKQRSTPPAMRGPSGGWQGMMILEDKNHHFIPVNRLTFWSLLTVGRQKVLHFFEI